MLIKNINVVWSDAAKADLKLIHDNILRKTKSKRNARNVKNDIIESSKYITFIAQYQIDESLGFPFRRIIVRHFKLIYAPINTSSVAILEVFDTYQNPIRLRK